MSELFLRYGWVAPLVTIALGVVVVLAWSRRRRPVADGWAVTAPTPGVVALDGKLQSSLRLPSGHVVAADGTSAGQCVLVLSDGRQVPFRGRLTTRSRIPSSLSESPSPIPLHAGTAIRVRGLLAPAELTGDEAAGYREVVRSWVLVPPGDEGTIELAQRLPSPGAWVLGAVLGAAVGLLGPGLGLVADVEELGLASPLFREEAAGALLPDLEERFASGDADAVHDVDAYVLAREIRGFERCPAELPAGAALEVVARLARVCPRPEWLGLALQRGWAGYGPFTMREWIAIAQREGDPVPELLPLEARLRVVAGETQLSAELLDRLPEHPRLALLDDPTLARLVAGEPDAVDPSLAHAPRGAAQSVFRLVALASARCGTADARPRCAKAFEDFELISASHREPIVPLQRELLRFGPMLEQVHARVAEGPLDPRVERVLLDRVMAFRMLVTPPSDAFVDEVVRVAARLRDSSDRVVSSRSRRKMRCWEHAPGRRHCRPYGSYDDHVFVIPRIAEWLDHPRLIEATRFPGDHGSVGPDTDPSIPLLPGRPCATPEAVPPGADLVTALHTRRRYRAICGRSPDHDRWIEAWSLAYLDPARGLRFARLEAAFAGLEPVLPTRELPPPPESTQTIRWMELDEKAALDVPVELPGETEVRSAGPRRPRWIERALNRD